MKSNIQKHISKNWMPRIMVIGGGFAGINFIKKFKHTKAQIIFIDKNNYHTFRPLSYQVATAGLEPGAISDPLRGMFKDQKNVHFRLAEAIKVECENNQLVTSKGQISYDYLVLANGSTGNFFGNVDVQQQALTLNSLDDALSIRERFIQNFEKAVINEDNQNHKLMNVVIVGGGPTGVELAGALAELRRKVLPKDYPDFDTTNLTIYLIEAQDRLLPAMTEDSANKAHKYLDDLGVEVMLNQMVEDCDDDKVSVDGGMEIPTNLIVWAAGTKGNLIDGFSSDQIKKGGLRVNEFNLVKDTRNVFAIGDVAHQETRKYPDGLPKLAPVAIQQSITLAKNIKRIIRNKQPKPFKYRDRGVMATIGRNKAVIEFKNLRYGGKLGWLTWLFVHLISIMGLRRKLTVMAHWVWSYFTYDKGNRLILGRKSS